MATYISLLNFTEQGARNIKDSPKRAEAFKEMSGKLGVTVKGMYWTMGTHDLVIITEGSDEAVMAGLMATAALGNERTQTLRAYSIDEMKKAIGLIP